VLVKRCVLAVLSKRFLTSKKRNTRGAGGEFFELRREKWRDREGRGGAQQTADCIVNVCV